MYLHTIGDCVAFVLAGWWIGIAARVEETVFDRHICSIVIAKEANVNTLFTAVAHRFGRPVWKSFQFRPQNYMWPTANLHEPIVLLCVCIQIAFVAGVDFVYLLFTHFEQVFSCAHYFGIFYGHKIQRKTFRFNFFLERWDLRGYFRSTQLWTRQASNYVLQYGVWNKLVRKSS